MLHCRHCRGAARDEDYAGELSTAECLRVVDAIAAFATPMLILTGGEPMTRPDIYDIARYATDKGLRVAMAPCGHLITAATARQIKNAGVKAISISIDGATSESHDAFRGVPGAFARTMQGLEHARAAGIPFQINTTVTKLNLSELPMILSKAIALGAIAFDVFFLVPTGRGAALAGLEITPDEYERALEWIARTAEDAPIRVRTTCAPHYARVVRQLGLGRRHAQEGHPGAAAGAAQADGAARGQASGCMAGRGFIFISHTGLVQPCGFFDVACGDLRAEGFNLAGIYRESTVFTELRTPDGYEGKCGRCEYKVVCGGCRARALAKTGSYLAEEPSCAYQPGGGG